MPVINQLIHIILLVASFLAILSGVWYLKYRTPMARWGGLFLFSLAIELFSYSFHVVGVISFSRPFWISIQFISFLLLPIFWLLFVAEIAGLMKKVWRRVSLLVLSVLELSLVALLAAWVIGLAHSGSAAGIHTDLVFELSRLFGPLGTFYVLSFYGLGSLSVPILILLSIKTNAESRSLVISMLLGAFLLGLFSLLDQFGFDPLRSFDLVQVGLVLGSGLFFLVAVVWQFGGILPISRERVFEGINDGVLVLDYFDTIVDINENALKIIGRSRKETVNQKLSYAWPLGAQLIAEHPGETLVEKECDLLVDGQEHNFDISVSQFIGLNEAPTGRLIVLRNVTTRERMEKTLNERAQELQRTNAFLAALAEVTVSLHTTTDPSKINAIVGSELGKLGLACLIAGLDPANSELSIKYISLLPDVAERVEKILGKQLRDYVLDRNQFPRLYYIVDNNEIAFRELYQGDLRYGPGKISSLVLEQILRLLHISPNTKTLVLPFVTGARTLGLMCVWGENLREMDIAPFRVFASQMAHVLERAVLYETEIKRSSELARSNAMVIALSNVAARLDTTADVMQVFATMGGELGKVQVNSMVGTLDDAKQVMKIEFLSISPEIIHLAEKMGLIWPKEVTIPRKLWPTDKAITEKAPYWDPDPIGNASKMFPYLPRQIFTKTFELAGMSLEDQVCYLPMIIEEDVIGILALWGPTLNQADIPAFSVFANQVATAVRATRLYDHAQQEIIERKQAELRIQQALNEKEVLLKEVHHRVKNNLQVISSLLSLQAAQIPDAATVDLLRESQNRVRSMALIHEKLYQSHDLARVDFAGYLQNLVNSLAQTYQVKPDRVALRIACEKIELNIDTAIPCGLIVNELVSNSLKYAFPADRSGTIEVSCCRAAGGRYRLVVSDNGCGLPDGFNIARSTSLGLKLVTSLVRQVEGEIAVNQKHGARFEIIFSES